MKYAIFTSYGFLTGEGGFCQSPIDIIPENTALFPSLKTATEKSKKIEQFIACEEKISSWLHGEYAVVVTVKKSQIANIL